MNIWLHRISHHAEVSYPLLDKGYLSIGWSDFSVIPEFVKHSCEVEVGGYYFDKVFDDEYGFRPRNRYSLWYFITQIKKGDKVIVPMSGIFSIYEIEDDKVLSVSELIKEVIEIKDWSGNSVEIGESGFLYNNGIIDENNDCVRVDLGFFRKVKPITTDISRYDYADAALTARMKIRQTTANISDLKENVEKALTAYKIEKPINFYSQIIEKASPHVLDTIRTELSPDKLEYLVKWYFERIGATSVYIPSKNESGKEGDADADVIATFEQIKTIIYTQVKSHFDVTSDWAIKQIKDYKGQKEGIDDGYSKIAWVISSGDSFSEEAHNLAKAENIQLFDGLTFATMLLEAGITSLEGAL